MSQSLSKDAEYTLRVFEAEYEQIKLEQSQRIGFRDNMVFVQLVAIGSVCSWVFTNLDRPHADFALLVIPWICIVLGWTYVVNDHMISRIGKYVRVVLRENVNALIQGRATTIEEDDGKRFDISIAFGWEDFHRTDALRQKRKLLQCIIDELTFVAPGVFVLGLFLLLNGYSRLSKLVEMSIAIEAVALLWLASVIINYADLLRGR